MVHHSHSVMASNKSDSNEIAFCLLYITGYRVTWAVLPWTVLVLSWLSLLPLLQRSHLNTEWNLLSSFYFQVVSIWR